MNNCNFIYGIKENFLHPIAISCPESQIQQCWIPISFQTNHIFAIIFLILKLQGLSLSCRPNFTRIRNLKYLEIKIEEWPNRAKWDKAGPNGAKWCQTGSNRAKWGQTGQNEAKKDLTGPNVAKRAKPAKRGQMGSDGADFLRARIFS